MADMEGTRQVTWFRRLCRSREDVVIDTKIKPPRQVFAGHDEALEARGRARREIAESVRKRSALIASGSPSGSVLKIARKE